MTGVQTCALPIYHGGEVEHSLGADSVVGEIEHTKVGEEEALVAESGEQIENAFCSNPIV